MHILLKREYLKNWPIVLFLLAAIILLPFFGLDDGFGFLYAPMILMVFSNNTNQDYQWLLSLPVTKKRIIISRYLFVFSAYILFFAVQYLLYLYIFTKERMTNPITVSLLFCFLFLIIAISLPIFYLHRSTWRAFFWQLAALVLLGILFIIFVQNPFKDMTASILNIFSIAPFLMMMLLLTILTWLTYRMSYRIFIRRDFA